MRKQKNNILESKSICKILLKTAIFMSSEFNLANQLLLLQDA